MVLLEARPSIPAILTYADFAARYVGLARIALPRQLPPDDQDAQSKSSRAFGFPWFVPDLLRHRAVFRDVLLGLQSILSMVLTRPLLITAIVQNAKVPWRAESGSRKALQALALVLLILLTACDKVQKRDSAPLPPVRSESGEPQIVRLGDEVNAEVLPSSNDGPSESEFEHRNLEKMPSADDALAEKRRLLRQLELDRTARKQGQREMDALHAPQIVTAPLYEFSSALPLLEPEFMPAPHEAPTEQEVESDGPLLAASWDRSAFWNVWIESFGPKPQFKPIESLRRNTQYSLVVNMSGFLFDKRQGVTGVSVSASLSDWLSRQDSNWTSVDILVIPDRSFFESSLDGEKFKTITIDLKQLRAVSEGRTDWPLLMDDPLAFLSNNEDALFNFGTQTFRIKTKGKIGRTSIALSFWVNGSRPVGELFLDVCVANNETTICDEAAPVSVGLRGADSIRIASESANLLPDAALHFLEIGSDDVIGVFRCNTCSDWGRDEFRTWYLGQSAHSLRSYLSNTIIPGLHSAQDDYQFKLRGKALYELLFQGVDEQDIDNAQQAFSRFVTQFSKSNQQMGLAPSIFVRLLPQHSGPLFLIPLGTMVPPELNDFLGFHFRVETPMERQGYQSRPECLARWVVLVPEKNENDPEDELQVARNQFSPWIERFSSTSSRATVFQDVPKFGHWVSEMGVEREDVALFVLSHHENNALRFSAGPSIESVMVKRDLGENSIVILNACGTGSPESWEFVRAFNARGAAAAIVTSWPVNANMAGQFADLLMQAVDRNSKAAFYPIGQAKFDAVRELSKRTAGRDGLTYGAKALIYNFIGNGGLRLCAPLLP